MDNTPSEVPAPAAAGESVTPTPTTNSEPMQAPTMPDMHGFTSEELAGMRTFIENNGGWNAIKSKISNPQPAPQPQAQPQPANTPIEQPQPQPQPQYKAPEGSITAQEFLAQQYFMGLSQDPKYAGISEQIASGNILKEMTSFNIMPLNQDGSINDSMVRRFLDLKAQTVPAKATGVEPNASTAPTVEYYQVDGDKITNIDQAYAIIQQDAQLKGANLGAHPLVQQAEEFIKSQYKKKA